MPLHPHIPTTMDLDLAVQRENHPVLLEEEEEKEGSDYDDFMLSHLPLPTPVKEVVEKVEEPEEPEEEIPAMISEEDTTESDDDFAKSSKSSKNIWLVVCLNKTVLSLKNS